MNNYSEYLKNHLTQSINNKQSFIDSAPQMEAFNQAATLLIKAYQADGRLYIAGNGGSAADAQHLAAEFVCRLYKDRPPIAAEALTVDSSILTSIANDYHYDEIFSRQIECKMNAQDVFLGITTSGNSTNIVKALEICQSRNWKSIVLTGNDGGKSLALAGVCLIAPGHNAGAIQEVHIALEHILCACVEQALYPEQTK